MARRGKKKGRPVSGWVIFDKPKGMASTEAVAKIKWLFQAEKAGHAGTLDPLASGMLPIALGEATKTVPYVMDGFKVYHFTVTWGQERSTDDLEGEVTNTSDQRPSASAIEGVLPHYIGVITQVPPMFSAIKIDGNRAYDLARDGETVVIPPRQVEIDELKIIEHLDGRTRLEVVCGKGTYVRALARDIGRELGCFGHVTELRRVEVAPFTEDDLVTFEELQNAAPQKSNPSGEHPVESPNFKSIDAFLIETVAALDCLSQFSLSEDQAHRVKMGNPVLLRGSGAVIDEDEVCVTVKGKLLAIGAIDKGQFKPRRVFTT